jgi:hypothetical protein
MPNDPLCTCTQDGCWCESDSTQLSDDALDTIRGGIRERLELARAKLADVRRQRRELLGLKQMTREHAAESIRISEGRAPNYQRLAPIAEEKEFEHFLPIQKRDPLGEKLITMSDEPVVELLEVDAPKKRRKLVEVWHG